MSTKYPQGLINGTPPYTTGNFSGVWTLEQLAKNYYFFGDGVSNSLRFRSSASAYLNRTPSVAGNRQTWTWSGWVKRGKLGGPQTLFMANPSSNVYLWILLNSDDTIFIENYTGSASTLRFATTPVYRDPSSWYHVVFAVDTTQATSTNRAKLYINGNQITSFAISTYPSQNENLYVNTAASHYMGVSYTAGSPAYYLDGYMAEVNFIDGLALDPSSFGVVAPATGVWSPKRYSGNYGLNGFYLPFSNGTSTTTLGYDSSGNGNNWTTNNISLTAGSTYDWMIDSPTPYQGSSYGVGNYAVLNPLQTSTLNTISNGNLTVSNSNSSTGFTFASVGLGTGAKFYFEATATGTALQIGIFSSNQALTPTGSKRYWYLESGGIYNDATLLQSVSTFTSGDVISVAWDGVAQTVTFYKNNTQQGTAVSVDTSYSYFFGVGVYNGGWNANFGQRPFSYSPPSGYKSLCTFNLPGPTINNGASYMAATLWTGNGANQNISNAVNGVSFQPDWVWAKARSNAQGHTLFDSVRGASKYLQSNSTNAEGTFTAVPSFNSDGFTSTTDVSTNGYTYVGWQWKAGGTAVTNTAGSITSSVSANTTSGFSVVTWANVSGVVGTIGHGLGVVPSFVIIKNRTGTPDHWIVYHSTLGATSYLFLDSTNASASSISAWNNTAPTSSVVTIGNGQVTGNYVAYCFAAIPGYSAFGSYTGNGSADGPFVYCGFRPRFVLIKRTDSIGSWVIDDSSRDPYNVAGNTLFPNSSAAESASNVLMDMVANGFKMRGANVNDSGGTFIYAAFCENPFNYSLAR